MRWTVHKYDKDINIGFCLTYHAHLWSKSVKHFHIFVDVGRWCIEITMGNE